jgi:hypothetical protein
MMSSTLATPMTDRDYQASVKAHGFDFAVDEGVAQIDTVDQPC